MPSRTKQVQFSSRKMPHSTHLRQEACHSRSGATRRMYWSWIGDPQPTHKLLPDVAELLTPRLPTPL